jgi:hypothetical protein
MTQTLPDDEIDVPAQTPATNGPGRLRLRRRLLLWSIPAAVLLLVFAVKLASVGILGNRLPGQFAARDQAGMDSTLGWIDVGNIGRGFRELLAAGDSMVLRGDLSTAREQFKAAHDKEPAACPPRANFSLTSEALSDRELKQGSFFKARTLLEPAVQTANEDKPCFATSGSPSPDIRAFVGQTPERLSNKLAALKAGALTETPDGFDYIRTPGGGIDFKEGSANPPCPFGDDEARLRSCIKQRDAERAQKVREAEQQKPADPNQPPPPPDAPPPPPPPNAPPAPAPTPAPESAETPEYPGRLEEVREGEPAFCTPDGKPLGDLSAALCSTSGPLP